MRGVPARAQPPRKAKAGAVAPRKRKVGAAARGKAALPHAIPAAPAYHPKAARPLPGVMPDSFMPPDAEAHQSFQTKIEAARVVGYRESLLMQLNAVVLHWPQRRRPKPAALGGERGDALDYHAHATAEASRLLRNLSRELREAGLWCVEKIVAWVLIESEQSSEPVPFLWNGQDYLHKMSGDLDFVAEALGPDAWKIGNFCKGNPLLLGKDEINGRGPRVQMGRLQAANMVLLDVVRRHKQRERQHEPSAPQPETSAAAARRRSPLASRAGPATDSPPPELAGADLAHELQDAPVLAPAGVLAPQHRPAAPEREPVRGALEAVPPADADELTARVQLAEKAEGVSPQLVRGMRIIARYEAGDEYFPGVISHIHSDGSCDIAYDDGDVETRVAPELVLPEEQMAPAAASRAAEDAAMQKAAEVAAAAAEAAEAALAAEAKRLADETEAKRAADEARQIEEQRAEAVRIAAKEAAAARAAEEAAAAARAAEEARAAEQAAAAARATEEAAAAAARAAEEAAAAAARAAEPEPNDEQYEEELDFEDESAEPPVAPEIPPQPVVSEEAAAAPAAEPEEDDDDEYGDEFEDEDLATSAGVVDDPANTSTIASEASALAEAPEIGSASDKYRFERLLGEGAYGTVYRGVNTDTGAAVALKKFKGADDDDEEMLEYVQKTERREIELLRALAQPAGPHPNIIELLDVFTSPAEDGTNSTVQCLVFELVPDGTCLECLEKCPGGFAAPTVRTLTRQLVTAVTHCHERGIVHRDIKPEKCVLCVLGSGPALRPAPLLSLTICRAVLAVCS